MSTEITQLGNQGIKIIVHVKKPDGSARDLTGAANLKIKLRASLASDGKTFAANFEGDPTEGALSCVTGVNDIDTTATWKAQAYYELGTFKGHTRAVDIFFVEENLAK